MSPPPSSNCYRSYNTSATTRSPPHRKASAKHQAPAPVKPTNVSFQPYPPEISTSSLSGFLSHMDKLSYMLAGALGLIWVVVSFGRGFWVWALRTSLIGTVAVAGFSAISVTRRNMEKELERVSICICILLLSCVGSLLGKLTQMPLHTDSYGLAPCSRRRSKHPSSSFLFLLLQFNLHIIWNTDSLSLTLRPHSSPLQHPKASNGSTHCSRRSGGSSIPICASLLLPSPSIPSPSLPPSINPDANHNATADADANTRIGSSQ